MIFFSSYSGISREETKNIYKIHIRLGDFAATPMRIDDIGWLMNWWYTRCDSLARGGWIRIQRYPLTWVACRRHRCRSAIRICHSLCHSHLFMFASLHYVSLNCPLSPLLVFFLFFFMPGSFGTFVCLCTRSKGGRRTDMETNRAARVLALRLSVWTFLCCKLWMWPKFQHHSFITTGRKSIFIFDIGSVWKPTIFQFDAARVDSRLLLLLLLWAVSYLDFTSTKHHSIPPLCVCVFVCIVTASQRTRRSIMSYRWVFMSILRVSNQTNPKSTQTTVQMSRPLFYVYLWSLAIT